MRGPSLQKSTALSAALHFTFFIVAALVLKQSASIVIPSPYVVNLVGPVNSFQERSASGAASGSAAGSKAGTSVVEPSKQEHGPEKDEKSDRTRVEDRLSELKAKKKLKDIVAFRSKVLEIKGSEGKAQRPNAAQKSGGGPSQGSLFDSYYARITSQIWQEWVYPDMGDKNLETIIAVKIARDGSVTVQRIEKGSGNALFDRSAMRAIAKASPVAPPPYEMEIGMRFYP
jgi:colicin import membrane protein